MKKAILTSLFLLHLLSPGTAHDCSWFVDTVKWDETLLPKSTTVGNTIESINTTSAILGIDIPNLLIYPPKEGFHSFPYFLRARIACNNLEISQEKGRSFALSGVKPVFILHLEQDDDTLCSVVSQLRMEGILIDKTNGTDVNCSSTICSPVWLAPLPVGASMLLMPVTIDVEGLGCEWLSARHVIHLDGFVRSTSSDPGSLINTLGEAASFNELEDVLNGTKAYPNKFVLELSPVEVISGFGNNLMLYSSDDFMNITLLRLPPVSGSPACPSSHFTSPDEIFDTVTLSDRVLISTAVGVLQVMGMFKSVVEMNLNLPWESNVVFNEGCVKEIIIPKQHYPKVNYVFLRTTDHKVYMNDQVNDLSDNATDVRFSEVTDAGHGVCDMTNDTYCQVLSIDVLPTGLVNCLILLATGDTPVLSDYKLLHFKDGSITLLYTIPKDVMINPTHANHVLLEESKLVNSEQQAIPKLLDITGMSTTVHISSEIYLWGSHLIQSFDGGNAFILMSGYNSDSHITLFTSSLDGHFVLLNDKQEIWIGLTASWFITRIYPSISWSTYVLADINDLSHKDVKTLSLFFDRNNQVNQLLGFKDDEGNVNIKHVKIPAVEILSNIVFEEVIHKDPRKLLNEIAAESEDNTLSSEEIACPFHSILFNVPHSIKGFTAKEVFRFGPPRQFHEYGHGEDALKGTLVHQAIVHLLLTKEQAKDRMYLDNFNSRTAKWTSEREKDKGEEGDTEFMFTNGLMQDGIHLHIEDYRKEFVPQNEVLIHLPELIYLDKNVTFHFTIELHLSSDEHIMEHETEVHNVEDLQISVKIANSSLLTVSTNRQELHQTEMIVFEYEIAASDTLRIQNVPGRDLLTSSVHFHVEDSLLKCVQQRGSGRDVGFEGSYKMNVLLGCPPNLDLMFDSQASLSALELSDMGEYPWDCLEVDPDFPCFYFGNVFYPFFKVIDRASGNSWRFEGNYTLKIVGGRIVQDEFYEQYTEEQVLHYNQQNFQLHQTLIWNPYNETFINENGWFVYSNLNNAITWTCLSNSPCAYVFPKQLGDAPEYYFELEFSNIDVDSSTFCAFKKRFKVHIHGLAMNMTTMPLYIVGGTTAIFMLFIFVYWLCHCQDDRLINGIFEMGRSLGRKLKPKVEPVKIPEYLSQLSLAVESEDILGPGAFPETLSDLKKSTRQWEQRRLSRATREDLPHASTSRKGSLPVIRGSSCTIGRKGSLPPIRDRSGSLGNEGSLPPIRDRSGSLGKEGSLPPIRDRSDSLGNEGSLPPIRDRLGSLGRERSLPQMRSRSGSTGREGSLVRIQEETVSRHPITEENNNNSEGRYMTTEL